MLDLLDLHTDYFNRISILKNVNRYTWTNFSNESLLGKIYSVCRWLECSALPNNDADLVKLCFTFGSLAVVKYGLRTLNTLVSSRDVINLKTYLLSFSKTNRTYPAGNGSHILGKLLLLDGKIKIIFAHSSRFSIPNYNN